ncbi:OmpA family protein [uncultured Rubinisphaera sp.]|uniref:OmpA/MotB family protein n=1 Tax=uncultured Rubinisphaera sp. TaxID=1678686 RepID=UPI000EC6CCDE|nr:flagellar motor protein MotB [Planctomycetaceae bacterium]|tara:strand:- start:20142 stop:20846 length:705 start_codon:yes stop_codon:yes gene_type:complete
MDDDGPPGVPEWVVTYGDMMSLLLTFFIMLVSLSQMKQDGEMRAMMDALNERFGSSPMSVSGVPGPSLQTNSPYSSFKSKGMRSEEGVKQKSQDSEGQVGAHKAVSRINHGSVVTIGGPASFDPEGAELSDEIKQTLDILAEIISQKPNMICIRGHASPVPLPADSQYANQFDLSFARAKNVAKYLVDEKKISRDRIIVSAAGDTEPRMLTRDSDQQSLNHRVDVFLIDTYIKP